MNDIKQEYLVQYDLLSDKGYRISWFKINETYRDTSNLRTDGKSIYGYLEMPDKPNGIYKNDKLLKKGIREFDVNGKGDLVYLTTTTITAIIPTNCIMNVILAIVKTC